MDEEQINQMLRYFEQYVQAEMSVGKALVRIGEAIENREDSLPVHLMPREHYVRTVAPVIAAQMTEANALAAARKAVDIAREIHKLTSPDQD